jgi:ribonuclease T1
LNLKRALVALVLLVSAAVSTFLVPTSEPTPTQQAAQGLLGNVALSALPKEGQRVYALIQQGGPFEFDKDGTVFGNRERLLPAQTRGFYREYTVTTPGVSHRGARRLVCGGEQRVSALCYYTDDHYESFRLVVK